MRPPSPRVIGVDRLACDVRANVATIAGAKAPASGATWLVSVSSVASGPPFEA